MQNERIEQYSYLKFTISVLIPKPKINLFNNSLHLSYSGVCISFLCSKLYIQVKWEICLMCIALFATVARGSPNIHCCFIICICVWGVGVLYC